jgi:hypothetical protein
MSSSSSIDRDIQALKPLPSGALNSNEEKIQARAESPPPPYEPRVLNDIQKTFIVQIDAKRTILAGHWYVHRYDIEFGKNWMLQERQVYLSTHFDTNTATQEEVAAYIQKETRALPPKNELGMDNSLITGVFYEDDGSLWWIVIKDI